jgi:hypothetical protein
LKDEQATRVSNGGPHPDSRLPYEKPAVAWEEPLEARPSLMGMCQKLSAEDVTCGSVGPFAS